MPNLVSFTPQESSNLISARANPRDVMLRYLLKAPFMAPTLLCFLLAVPRRPGSPLHRLVDLPTAASGTFSPASRDVRRETTNTVEEPGRATQCVGLGSASTWLRLDRQRPKIRTPSLSPP